MDDWLNQFKDADRDIAARILDAVDFYSMDRISGAFQAALGSLPGWHRDAINRTGKWRFAALARSAGESADAMLHRFRVANGLDGKAFNELFIHPSEIVLQKLGQDDTLVLVDDFVGSGDSACKAWSEVYSELAYGVGRVYFIVVAAVSMGRARIANETVMTCVSGQDIGASDDFFNAECEHFNSEERVAILKYCERANKREPKGYSDCGLVVAFQHRCPNNSLPILHAEHAKWTGLFPRHG